jgi:hypothetical protein
MKTKSKLHCADVVHVSSVRDVLEFRRCGLDIPSALKVFRDAARGMDFLHKYDNVIKLLFVSSFL